MSKTETAALVRVEDVLARNGDGHDGEGPTIAFESFDDLAGLDRHKKPGSVNDDFVNARATVGHWRRDLGMLFRGMTCEELPPSEKGIKLLNRDIPYVIGIPQGTVQGAIEAFLHALLTIEAIRAHGRESLSEQIGAVITYANNSIDNPVGGRAHPPRVVYAYGRYRDNLTALFAAIDQSLSSLPK